MVWIFGTELEERGSAFAVPLSPVSWDNLVNGEMAGNFLRHLDFEGSMQGVKRQSVLKGANFVDSLAANTALWQLDGDVPWTSAAEELICHQLVSGDIDRDFLVGVIGQLRDGKRKKQPIPLIAGFLILSQMFPVTLQRWFPGINLGKTCDAGCELGGAIKRAALIARHKLGLPASSASAA